VLGIPPEKAVDAILRVMTCHWLTERRSCPKHQWRVVDKVSE